MKSIALMLVLLASGLRAGQSANKPATDWVREEGSIDTMGSVTAIVAYGKDAGRTQAAISHALDEARRIDDLLLTTSRIVSGARSTGWLLSGRFVSLKNYFVCWLPVLSTAAKARERSTSL